MPRPTIKAKVGSTTAPKVPQKVSEVEEAQQAVEQFEQEYKILLEMRDDYRKSFPEAYSAQQELLRQEDIVREAIKTAHPLVQQAKQTIGDFECQRKWAQAGYDEKKFMEIIDQLPEGGELIKELLSAGVVKAISLDKKAVEWFAQNPDAAQVVTDAWRDKHEKTAAVTCPKI